MSNPLGRRVPKDWAHVEKHPICELGAAAPSSVPVVLGISWYSNFDSPEKGAQGHYWIGRGSLGTVRGGHCVCLQPPALTDSTAWQEFYDQGSEGACVGFGSSRAMTLLNRKRYEARWLWDMARLGDEFPDNDDLSDPDQGTTVRAAFDILRARGHVAFNSRTMTVDEAWMKRDALSPGVGEGMSANRWATTADEVVAALGQPADREWVAVLNSWGLSYPRAVRLPLETLQRLLDEQGEAGIPTDR